ncbi:MAG: zf-TFIIB domain-containing protein [Nitrospina sp.]|nr:zf-TFIIB domain-containing protein [Nitrospina sp.]MBT6716321.1 zf-TFIIB domain-containing protein [Nitrospina sp.]
MKCPACENKLTEHKASGISINVCQNSCGGFWFHLSQIRKLDRVNQGAGYELLLVKGRVNSYQCGGVKVYHSG